MKKYLSLLFLAVCCGILVFSFNETKKTAVVLTPDEIVSATNKARAEAGLTKLHPNPLLSRAADEKTSDMAANQYFAHQSPSGKTPWEYIQNQDYKYVVAGENLAINFFSSGELLTAWLNSPEHKENILNPHFRDTGVNVKQIQIGKKKYVLIVQMFGAPQTLGLK